MAEQNKDVIEKLLTTGIIGKVWPPKTYLIVVMKNRSGKVIWKGKYQTLPKNGRFSTNENHTERQMLVDKEFKECLGTGEVEEIILTSNYSPCKYCARDLIQFYERNKKLKLTIRFSHPYETKEDKSHLEGLKDLDRAGITLESMTKKSWLDVLMNEEHLLDIVLKCLLKFMFDLDPGDVEERDNATRKRLAELLKSDGSEAEGSGGSEAEGSDGSEAEGSDGSEVEGIGGEMERFNLESDSD